MEINPKTLSADSVVRRIRKEEIDLAPEYQRGTVWSKRKQQLLIDSILRGYDLPKIYTRKVRETMQEVVDGQQRLTAITAFMMNEITLPSESGELSGLKYEELPADFQDVFNSFQLTFSVISDASDDEIREMFLRLQMGVKLNAAEELNAVAGKMHDFVDDLSTKAVFSKCASFSNHRGAHRHVAAQLAKLAVVGMGDCRKKDLLHLYATHAHWTPNEAAKKLKQVVEFAGIVFSESDALLRNRGQSVSLIYVLYALWDDLVFKGQEAEVRKAFENFDENVLRETPEYADYRNALSHSSDGRKSIEIRHRFVLAALAKWAPGLRRKDPKRSFDLDERAAIYYRDGGVCQEPGCGVAVAFNDFHADHILAWSKGGVTTLANAQLLCKYHNLAKGNLG